jgi:branched-chain amino acid aminotransferase
MIGHFLIDGELPKEGLDWSSRLFKYGDGFFETMRFFGGRIQHAYLHQQRCLQSQKLLKMPDPEVSFETLEQTIAKYCMMKGISSARIRLGFYREADGFYRPKNPITRSICEIYELDYEGYPFNTEGLILGSFKELTKNSNYTSLLKSTSALIYVMAGLHAKETDVDDVIIFNDSGRVCESMSSNLFAVIGDFIITPPLDEFCVDGIMRKIVLQLARDYGYEVAERPLSEIDLNGADEIFLTNAAYGIQWVGNFQGKNYRNVVSRVLSGKLVDGRW